MKKVKKFRIWLWSEMKDKYAPSLQPLQNTPEEARAFGRAHLKLDENLAGKQSFEVRPELVC